MFTMTWMKMGSYFLTDIDTVFFVADDENDLCIEMVEMIIQHCKCI